MYPQRVRAASGDQSASVPVDPSRLSCIGPPWWDDKPLAIVGAGPSLRGFDFARLDIPGVRVLAVKEKIFDLPFAQAVFGLDRPWISRQADRLRELKCEVYLAPTGDLRNCADVENATYLQLKRYGRFSDALGILESGGNSGFAAVNLAYLKRAKRIVLFGFDYTERGGHHDKPEQYSWYRAGQNARYWQSWGENFTECLPQLKKAGVEIVNASPISTVSAFPKVSIDAGLQHLARLGAARACGI